ncbi:zinc ABC transporter permease subunit ZnuB [Thioflexithrix psekupsensis]|uniref:High-affinity zinc uptake system membrane protein ZnuB n=1 Tax=Thioflexithrix psekupsensis TaxID=1570016 RepID=A0A251XAB5_9GAMM|nr:zinc ABC transporter permease subunit ZnuB [Thioflexithrix psekupsensis]OUD14462.1 zinc ABC transporter permease [Thioflexithrix psekupsensis]
MDDFMIRAVLGGLGVALIAGPLGCFVVWQRMAYFGDTLAHSTLLGLALGILLEITPIISIVLVCFMLALLLGLLKNQKKLASDTLLGILAHSTLALGLVTLSFLEGFRLDLHGYLFGDLLAVNHIDLYWIYGGGMVVLILLWRSWSALLSITIHEELAQVEGIAVHQMRLLLMLMLALVIAVAMKIVGILLITSMLIIPAAAARYWVKTPEWMTFLAAFLGSIAVLGGLSLSYFVDTPAGPSIVVMATILFILSFSVSLIRE